MLIAPEAALVEAVETSEDEFGRRFEELGLVGSAPLYGTGDASQGEGPLS